MSPQKQEEQHKYGKTVGKRMARNKKKLLRQLEVMPIISIACQKAGLGRATYYRWEEEDGMFAQEADIAIERGGAAMSDLAESVIVKSMYQGDKASARFWLAHRNKNYKQKLECGKNPVDIERIKELAIISFLVQLGNDGKEIRKIRKKKAKDT